MRMTMSKINLDKIYEEVRAARPAKLTPSEIKDEEKLVRDFNRWFELTVRSLGFSRLITGEPLTPAEKRELTRLEKRLPPKRLEDDPLFDELRAWEDPLRFGRGNYN
jgi:hypothetical protein